MIIGAKKQAARDGKPLTIKGTLVVAGEVVRNERYGAENNVCYTKEALQKAADQFEVSRRPEFGVIYRDGMKWPYEVRDIAFKVEDIHFDGTQLILTAEPFKRWSPGPDGSLGGSPGLFHGLLEIEKKKPGSISFSMGGHAERTHELEDGTVAVEEFELERVSVMQKAQP